MIKSAGLHMTVNAALMVVTIFTGATLVAVPADASSLQYQLDPGDNLGPGLSIKSPDGLYWLTVGNDGNLHETEVGSNVVIGQSHTAGNPGAVLFMQTDGNLVLRAPGNRPIWATATAGHPGTVLQIQDDGAVVLYAPGHQALHVIVPTLNDASVPTPRLSPIGPAAPAPGVNDPSEIGADVWDGTRVIGCASAGKIIEEIPDAAKAAAIAEEEACGMITNKDGAKLDGYGVFNMSGSIAAGLAIGGPWGAAASAVIDILGGDDPAN